MKYSRSTGYGSISAGYIALNGDRKIAIRAKTISKEYDIPLEYLLKILQNLVKAGILRSKRGPRGGFYLHKQPAEVSVLDVIVAVDGPPVSEIVLPEDCEDVSYMQNIVTACDSSIEVTKDYLAKVTVADPIEGNLA